jgi:hypothetical protein
MLLCGKTIQDGVARVIVLPIEDDAVQSMWSHEACLKQALHPSVPFAELDE